MPSYTSSGLAALRARRVDGERQAERTLAEASEALRRAEAEADRLAERAAAAEATLAAARVPGTEDRTAAEAQVRGRFWDRLRAEARRTRDALASFRRSGLADAARAVEIARAAHLAAWQRREVVEKAIARREAAARREVERRQEAAADDRGTRRPL